MSFSYEGRPVVRDREKAGPPLIILLGGAPGTGKTTLARTLVQELGLVHHLSTGFVREVARALLPPEQVRLLEGFTFDAWRLLAEAPQGKSFPSGKKEVFTGAWAQARALLPAMEACIRRSVREGSSLALEGAHILPGLLEPAALGVSLLCILDVPNQETLLQRAQGPSHSRRQLTQEQLTSILELQADCVHAARKQGIPVIDNTVLSEALAHVKRLLGHHAAG